ncbi:MAG: glutaredoxin 3 [Burkholderiales bacterium]|nr:glutaredoxin 3 [Burkholderiales bacterium]
MSTTPDPAVPVTMYSTGVCPYCVRAESFLKSKGVTTIAKVRIDLDPARRAEMMERTGRRTVPQIYVGDVHVGGFDDLVALDRAGKLAPLLAGQ